MRRRFWRAWAATLAVVLLTRCDGGQGNSYSFSSKAIELVPDIARRVESPDLNDRIGVLDELVARDARSRDFLHFVYVHDLSRDDYLSVARSILEARLSQIQDHEKVGMALLKVRQLAMDFKLSELVPQTAALLQHDNPAVQICSLMMLEQLGAEEHIREIAKAASSRNPDVRQPALEILLKSNSREAVPALLSCLKDEKGDIRRRAIEALERIGDRSAISDLIPLLRTDLSTWAIHALVHLEAREAIPYIKELYRPGETNSDSVLIALVYFGDEQAISQVMTMMVDDDQGRGEYLLTRLVSIKARAAVPALICALAEEKTLGGRSSRGPNIIGQIMVALSRLEAQEAVPVLRRYLAFANDRDLSGRNGFFAGRAIEALGILRAREAIPELVHTLNSGDYSLRLDAQIALARIGEASTIEKVIASLKKHGANSNHVQVLEELANISDPNTYRALSKTELSRIESASVEEYLRQITGQSGVKFAFSDTVPLPAEQRRKVVAALARSTGLSALERVIGVLNYSAPDYALFIRDGVVHVVSVQEAYALWDRWLREYAENRHTPGS